MFRLDAKLEPQNGSFQFVGARDAWLVPLDQPGLGRIAVNVPRQMNGWFGATGSAVHSHRITDLVARLAARNPPAGPSAERWPSIGTLRNAESQFSAIERFRAPDFGTDMRRRRRRRQSQLPNRSRAHCTYGDA
uniref:Uncharacterized protein n=1 Tax=Anopheles coluzzii TaxID=1518534 RepID=A0A8W7PFX6_ANOCL